MCKKFYMVKSGKVATMTHFWTEIASAFSNTRKLEINNQSLKDSSKFGH